MRTFAFALQKCLNIKQNNDVSMKKSIRSIRLNKCLILALLFVGSFAARSQVMEYDIRADVNSIIRTVNDSSILIYAQENSTLSHFVLVNEVTGQSLAFVMPGNVIVHDFRVYGGRDVYFCGTDGSNAVVGKYEIQGVFFLGGGVLCWSVMSYFPYPPNNYISNLVWVQDFTRLSLYEVGGQVCMAMVGDASFDEVIPQPKTVVASAYHDGVQWHAFVDGSKPYDVIRFTDIACLDDVIVAVGTHINNSGCYIKSYEKVLNFPGNPFFPSSCFKISFKSPVGDVLVTQYAGNVASVAHYDLSGSTVLHRVGFDVVGAIPTMAAATWRTIPSSAYPYSSSWMMYELGTTPSTIPNRHNYLLQKTDYPVDPAPAPQPWLVRFDNVLSSGAMQAAVLEYHSCSLDIENTGLYPRVSGHRPNVTVYDPITNMMENRCKSPSLLDVEYSSAPVEKPRAYDGAVSTQGPGFIYPVTILDVQRIMICD